MFEKVSRFALLVVLSLFATPSIASTEDDVAQAQRYLNKLGYDAGSIDGLWGKGTRGALEAFLGDLNLEFDGQLNEVELELLELELAARGISTGPTVNWPYRATSIAFAGYDGADQPAYDVIRTIKEIPDYGLNVVTLDFRCVGKIDRSAPDDYPVGRKIGCSIANKQILEDEGFVSTRRDATSLAIDEARAVGLAVNLKPMFLELGNRFGNGNMQESTFFEGDGSTWSGYAEIIEEVARYAQENQVEYLTIGTELNNLNGRLENSGRWPEIVQNIRRLYDGKLIYAHNYNNDSNLRNLSTSNVMRFVDIVGINYFPTRILGGREEYTANEVALALRNAKSRAGRNMMSEVRKLREQLDVPIILSETTFPTWRGSANWSFRGTCDYQNEGRSGWEFTKGPLQPKTPSDEHGRLLANGVMLAFENEAWVHGVDYLYWSVAHAHDSSTDQQQFGPCSSWLWESEDGIKELIKSYHSSQ